MTIATRHPADPVAARSSRFERAARYLSSWRVWAASTAAFVAFAAVFFGTRAPFSIPTVESTCGQPPPDVRFTSSAADVNDFLVSCGAAGRSAYISMQLADLVYPAVFGVFLATSLALALRRIGTKREVLVGLAMLPMLGMVFDYVENAFAWRALAAFPETSSTDGLLGLASAAKTTTFWIAGLLLVAAVAVLVVRAMHARRRRDGTPSIAAARIEAR